jgi:hypothetical protein
MSVPPPINGRHRTGPACLKGAINGRKSGGAVRIQRGAAVEFVVQGGAREGTSSPWFRSSQAGLDAGYRR